MKTFIMDHTGGKIFIELEMDCIPSKGDAIKIFHILTCNAINRVVVGICIEVIKYADVKKYTSKPEVIVYTRDIDDPELNPNPLEQSSRAYQ